MENSSLSSNRLGIGEQDQNFSGRLISHIVQRDLKLGPWNSEICQKFDVTFPQRATGSGITRFANLRDPRGRGRGRGLQLTEISERKQRHGGMTSDLR